MTLAPARTARSNSELYSAGVSVAGWMAKSFMGSWAAARPVVFVAGAVVVVVSGWVVVVASTVVVVESLLLGRPAVLVGPVEVFRLKPVAVAPRFSDVLVVPIWSHGCSRGPP